LAQVHLTRRYFCAKAAPQNLPDARRKSISLKHFSAMTRDWHPYCFGNVQTENGLAARSSTIR
jgi:hypothetical protein